MGCTCWQEEALARTTLREVEHLLCPKQDAMAGPKGSVSGAEELVVREALPEAVYSEEAVEQLLGARLEDMFAGNAAQLRCLAVAREAGAERPTPSHGEVLRVPVTCPLTSTICSSSEGLRSARIAAIVCVERYGAEAVPGPV